nr:zeta toxin family protein [Streptomonospora nanhaiensis]
MDEKESDQLYAVVKRAHFGHLEPQDQPYEVTAGAQVGAGKTTLMARVVEAFRDRGGIARIDLDFCKTFHPLYERLLAEDPETAGAYTGNDGRIWMERLLRDAAAEGYNALFESAMAKERDFEGVIDVFRSTDDERRAAGKKPFLVIAPLLVVHPAVSRLGLLTRLAVQRADGQPGLLVGSDYHARSYAGVLRGAAAIDERRIAHQVYAVRRDGEVLYSNSLGPDGRWLGRAAAVEAVARREERLSLNESTAFRNQFLWTAHELGSAGRDALMEVYELARPALHPAVAAQPFFGERPAGLDLPHPPGLRPGGPGLPGTAPRRREPGHGPDDGRKGLR